MRLQAPFLCVALLSAATACPADDPGTSDDGSTAGSGVDTSGSTSDGSVDSTGVDSTGEASTSGAPDLTGEEFFLSVCAACHGPDGEGTPLGYAIQHPVRDYSTWVVRNGRPAGNEELPGSVMAAYEPGTLSDAMLEEIWDYLDAYPQPTTGEALFMDYCRNCHGEDALGGVTGVNLRDSEALDEIFEKVREGEHVGEWSNRTEAMPAFDESRLSDAEIQLIADHIGSL